MNHYEKGINAIWEEAECYVEPTNKTSTSERWFYTSISRAISDISNKVYGTNYSQYNVVVLKSEVIIREELVILSDIITLSKTGTATLKLADDYDNSKAMFVVGRKDGEVIEQGRLTISGETNANIVISQGTIKDRVESLIVVNPDSTLNITGNVTFEKATVYSDNRGGVITSLGCVVAVADGDSRIARGVVNITGNGVIFSGNMSINGGAIYVGEYAELNVQGEDVDGIKFGKTTDSLESNIAQANGGAILVIKLI